MQILKDYKNFIKLRLTLLVLFSSAFGYLFGIDDSTPFVWSHFLIFLTGGFMITSASNGINQIIEVDLDRLMNRTADRGLPTGRMSRKEALIAVNIMIILGVYLLLKINIYCLLLSLTSLLWYVFFYTPVKRLSPLATMVGAFPGAFPPILGMLASTSTLDFRAWILFLIQFLWQFPHFWSIAWVCDEDYKRAGFKLLPTTGGRDKRNAFEIMLYCFLLIPVAVIPFINHLIGMNSTLIIFIASILFFIQTWHLYRILSIRAGKLLMFGSFLYLPLVQITLLLGKIA